jgi:hypothetical protein
VSSRQCIVVVEEFYRDPQAVRNYALRQQYYLPYEREDDVEAGRARATWWASYFRCADECQLKSSPVLIEALEAAVEETIDLEHWRAPFPVDHRSKPLRDLGAGPRSCLWNCCFHVKPANAQRLGDGVHNHVTDSWNPVGPDGWAGILYLTPSAPLDGGLHLWRNVDPARELDWMTPAKNWELVDSLGNVFNRLILVRGDVPHSGAAGWGNRVEEGRMYQTFFFRTHRRSTLWPVSLPAIGA